MFFIYYETKPLFECLSPICSLLCNCSCYRKVQTNFQSPFKLKWILHISVPSCNSFVYFPLVHCDCIINLSKNLIQFLLRVSCINHNAFKTWLTGGIALKSIITSCFVLQPEYKMKQNSTINLTLSIFSEKKQLCEL